MHKILLLAAAISLTIISCKKGEDFVDNTSQFPIGWKSYDSFNLIAYNIKDTFGNIINVGTCPLGNYTDVNFGQMQTGFFASFQTTLNSTNFSFTSIDSAVLILPYTAAPRYGKLNTPMDFYVYELSEAIETASSSKKMNYSYDASPVGSKLGHLPNTTDSILDGGSFSAPSLRIPLTLSFANKLIAKGSYTDDADFQSVLKGLYCKVGTTSTNGFLMISLNSKLRIKIYGKNSSNETLFSEFTTGGTKSTTVNQILHDNNSKASLASSSANMTTGDLSLYNCGLFGYYNQLILPNLQNFSKEKDIFKAELTLYTIDTGFYATTDLGFLFIDSALGTEAPLPDDYYRLNHKISSKDTVISGIPTRRFIYNIGMHLNSLISGKLKGSKCNIYSSPIAINSSGTTKFSNFIPSRVVLAGNMQPLAPKLTLYYINK